MKIYFWSKSATKPKRSSEDVIHFNEVTVEEDIHSLLRALERRLKCGEILKMMLNRKIVP